MTIKQLIDWASRELFAASIEEHKSDAKRLMKHLLKTDSHGLLMDYDKNLDDSVVEEYKGLVLKRAAHMPVQYITGGWEFYGLWFKLSNDTLIPRSDTEILVEECLKLAGEKSGLKFLDLCCGSGCIGISLLKNICESSAVLLDKSEGAVKISLENCVLNGVREKARVIEGDVFEIKFDDNEFDFIVSNPPYIRSADIKNLERSVIEYEPILALDGGEDGLDFYRCIIKRHTNALKSGGYIVFEIGDALDAKIPMSGKITEMLMHNGYKDIKTVCDLNKIQRVITAQKI